MSRFSKYHSSGFTLIEMLMSLMITLMICLSIPSIYRLVNYQNDINNNEDLFLTSKMLSEYIISSKEMTISDNQLLYKNMGNEDVKIYFDDKNRLVKEKGYEILGTNIDEGRFEIEDELIYLNLKRDEKSYRFLVGFKNEVFEKQEGN